MGAAKIDHHHEEESNMELAKDLNIVPASVSERFQTVIPAKIREQLNLKVGDKVEYVISEKGEIIIRKAPSEKEQRQAWLSSAFETYEGEDLWSDLKNEPFRE